MVWSVLLLLIGPAFLAAQTADSLAPSDELNKQLPGWLRFSGDYRARMEGVSGLAFRDGNQDAYLLNRFRLNMKVQPKSWLSFSFQGQDARAFGRSQTGFPPLAEDSMDLRMAFVEFGDSEKKPLGLRVGRQELAFGDQRLVGHVSWANGARTFDAVRATLRRGGVRLDAFAASVVVLRDGEFNRHADGDNFHGLYGVIEKLIPKATVEPYLFWRVAPRKMSETGNLGKLDFKTVGFRWYGKLPARFDYTVQVAGQVGSQATDDIRAWACEWMLGHTLPSPWTPRISAEYNYASGDRKPGDGERGTFDILYPTPHDIYGLADQVGWKNIHDLRSGVELQPRPKLRLKVNYHSWWRASLEDGLYNAGGALSVRSPGPAAGRHIGQELDFQAYYTINPRIQIAGGVGHIFPGTFLERASPGASLTYPYVMLGYSF